MDREFDQSKIKLGKAFAAEQKLREFKKLLFERKVLDKQMTKKRIKPIKLIQKATNNLNKIKLVK